MDPETRTLQKLDDIQREVTDLREEVRVGFAELPSAYVTQTAMDEARRQSRIAKRFAVASIIASIGALGTYLGLFVALL